MSTQVDLRELAVDRSGRGSAAPRRPRSVLSRYVLPGVLVAGFVALLGWSLGDRLLPATPVTVVPVVATRADVQAADTPLFQAAGWVEPRPTPVVVSSLAEGVVERLTVIEGQAVEAGQPVAYLIDADARLAVRQAEADLALQQAELGVVEAGLEAAGKLLAEPIALQAQLADAQAQLTKTQTELARLPAMREAAQARVEFAEQELESKQASSSALPAITIRRAESDLKVARAQLEEYGQQASALAEERTALTRRRDVLARQLELKIDEERAVAEGRANVASAKAQIEQAAAAVDIARLRLERSVIRAPQAGNVLALVARPGTKLMGLAPASMADSSTVITMYDPTSLQVRADVRLEDVPRVSIGQRVTIETPAVSQPLTGQVITATSLADIQKNTLQVKVAIENPPPVIKPDMLVQVTFLAPPQPQQAGHEEHAETATRIAAPRVLLEGSGERASVWIADTAAGVARRREVTLGHPISQHLVEIKTGLAIGDRLIVQGREQLEDGDRIRITGEDPVLGKTESR
jgi:multidrug efflux pump subunit AcrA (membrane-fusion protein)